MAGRLVLMAVYTYFATEITSGRVVAELPLTGVTAERNLKGGKFGATLSMKAQVLPPLFDGETDAARFARSATRLQELRETTTPGKYSIVVDRDGVPVGEWIIWQRTTAEPYTLQGSEFLSILDHRFVGRSQTVDFQFVDQSVIAATLVSQTMTSGAGLPAYLDVPGFGGVPQDPQFLSGQLRQRTYQVADNVGQRLAELSDVQGGFDMTVSTRWRSVASTRYVQRTLSIGYPRAGYDWGFVFDQPGPGYPGGAIVSLSYDEDAANLASQVWALGQGNGTDQLLGYASRNDLQGRSFPVLERSVSYSTVSDQRTINGYAAALVNASQSAELPPVVVVRADADPVFPTYSLGDRVLVVLDPTPALPSGYRNAVRILGFTLQPPTAGPEFVALTVTTYNAAPGSGSVA